MSGCKPRCRVRLSDGAGELFAALLGDAGFRSNAAAVFLRKLASQIGQQNRAADVETSTYIASRITRIGRGICVANPRRIIERSSSQRQRTGPTLRIRRLESCRRGRGKDDPCTSMAAASDDSVDAGERIDAIDALSFGSFEQVESALVSLLDNRQPNQVQRAAITTLGKFSSPRVAPPLLRAWPGLSPQLRETASEVLLRDPIARLRCLMPLRRVIYRSPTSPKRDCWSRRNRRTQRSRLVRQSI